MARFVRSRKIVERALGRTQAFVQELGPLFGVYRLDGQKLRADRSGLLLTHTFPRGDQLGSLPYKLIRAKAQELRGIAVHLAAKLHSEAGPD